MHELVNFKMGQVQKAFIYILQIIPELLVTTSLWIKYSKQLLKHLKNMSKILSKCGEKFSGVKKVNAKYSS